MRPSHFRFRNQRKSAVAAQSAASDLSRNSWSYLRDNDYRYDPNAKLRWGEDFVGPRQYIEYVDSPRVREDGYAASTGNPDPRWDPNTTRPEIYYRYTEDELNEPDSYASRVIAHERGHADHMNAFENPMYFTNFQFKDGQRPPLDRKMEHIAGLLGYAQHGTRDPYLEGLYGPEGIEEMSWDPRSLAQDMITESTLLGFDPPSDYYDPGDNGYTPWDGD